MSKIEVKIEESWKMLMEQEFQQPYFAALRDFLIQEKKDGHVIYPPGHQIFHAFNLCPFPSVKVVIIGQDPYHGAGQAHGLCFSVADGVAVPPSLANIFKELKSDLGIPISNTGNLTKWATQGVLLLNALLTVRANQPASHHDKGWERFTNAVIRAISENSHGIIFLLWGKYAQEKEALVDSRKHHILKSAHPSPFSATKFFGCRHFSKTNALLVQEGRQPIDWRLQ